MKRAFTTIELIFVIIILGILSAIVISRLAVIRDDAEIAKIGLNLNRIIGDFRGFYTSQGELKNLSSMTYVQFSGGGNSMSDTILVSGVECIKLTLVQEQNNGKPAFVKIEAQNNTNHICQKTIDSRAVKNLLENKFSYIVKSTGDTEFSGVGEIEISGVNSRI